MKRIEDQVILVTGSTDGIGKRAAHDLAELGATVLLHGRDPRKGGEVLRELKAGTGSGKLRYYNADLSSLAEVRSLANALLKDWQQLDVLVNNAGIGTGKPWSGRQMSRDGYELRFAVNYLAPFLLTHLLLPALRRAAPTRVVNVASLGQHILDFEDVMLERHYSPGRAYGQSKLALIMFSFDLAEELKGEVTVNVLHPGSLLNTKMVREALAFPLGSAQQGADAEVYLATSPELEGITGRFFNQRRETRAYPQAYESEARRKLRELSFRLTGL